MKQQAYYALNAVLFIWAVITIAAVVILTKHIITNALVVPVPLITGESDIDSKFIVERFDNVSVSLVTDKLTGCEYVLSTSGITPRMYSDGIQVCGQSTYPNGEHHE